MTWQFWTAAALGAFGWWLAIATLLAIRREDARRGH